MASVQERPVFVHASPRSGSTFFFHALRSVRTLICFNETLSDSLEGVTKRSLGQAKEQARWNFNHEFLKENDRAEVIEAWDWVRPRYPRRPAFRDFLPGGGLPDYLRLYLDGFVDYARTIGRRPAFCEVYSRGRAGALRAGYGGYHIAQFRDPISQFGSFYRALEDGGLWYFLCDPVVEIGVNGKSALFDLIPLEWRLPEYPWPGKRGVDIWLSYANYKLLVASARPSALELAFRTHVLSWFLTNVSAICFSDLVLDIDKLHDDSAYRAGVVSALEAEIGGVPDFTNLTKYTRYLRFEAFDSSAICAAIAQLITSALHDGRLETAVRSLSPVGPNVRVSDAVECLLAKLNDSLTAMTAASTATRYVDNATWAHTVSAHRVIWQNGCLKELARLAYPGLAPLVHAFRRAANRI